jgi:hypothetical protein
MSNNSKFIRRAALWLAAGSAVGAIIAFMSIFVPLLSEDTPAVTIPREVVLAAHHLMILVGLFGLWSSGAAGDSTWAKIAFGIAAVTRGVFAIAELIWIFNITTADTLFSIATPLHGVGMIGVGVAVLVSKRWQSWHSYMPLLCGLYIFAVLLPAFVMSGGINFYAIGSWSLLFLVLGAALWQEADKAGAAREARVTQVQSKSVA